MKKLINSVQNYAWGSKTALTDLYGIANPENKPMAELWMGAHPKSSSKVLDAGGQPRPLREVIDLSLIHISEPTRRHHVSRMPSSA